MADRRLPVVLLVALALVAVPVGPATGQTAPADEVTAAGAVLWDPLDGRVLWARAPSRPRRMASTTKIMTALLAVEAGTLDDTVTVSAAAAAADADPGSATLNLRAGQQVGMRDLLTALMMRSGNDAAAAVAEHVTGSEDAFVAAMNARARELGLDDTQFLDPTGLSDSAAHHASPADLAQLAQTAMALPGFPDLVGTYRADVPGFGTLTSRNLLLAHYRGANGVKTGYTALAGFCLVGSATRDGRTYYTAVLDSDDTFADTTVLLDHAFEDFTVMGADDVAAGVYRTAAGAVPLRIVDATPHTVPVAGTVRVRSFLLPTPPSRIAEGTRLGRAELVVDGKVVDTATIESADPLDSPPTMAPAGAAGAAVEDAVRAFVRATPRRTTVRTGG
ncbi:MAG TPA: serine hydrolase [Euzebyales bacterium]|nr:serine hydrolase [Euzebyales bacterium]